MRSLEYDKPQSLTAQTPKTPRGSLMALVLIASGTVAACSGGNDDGVDNERLSISTSPEAVAQGASNSAPDESDGVVEADKEPAADRAVAPLDVAPEEIGAGEEQTPKAPTLEDRAPKNQTPSEEMPAEEMPAAEIGAGENETPTGETPAEEVPLDEAAGLPTNITNATTIPWREETWQLADGETLRSWQGAEVGEARSPAVINNTLFFCADSRLKKVDVLSEKSTVETVDGADKCTEIAAYDENHLMIAYPAGVSTLMMNPDRSYDIEQLAVARHLMPTESLVLTGRPEGGVYLSGESRVLFLFESGVLQRMSELPTRADSLQPLGGTRWAHGLSRAQQPLSFLNCETDCSESLRVELLDEGVEDMAASRDHELYVALRRGDVVVVDSVEGNIMKRLVLPDGERATGIAHTEGRCSDNLFITTMSGMVFWQDLLAAGL